MKEIADFIRYNFIEHDWRGNHFYIWPTFIDMEDLKNIIPWDMTEYRQIGHAAVCEDGFCIDLLEIFEAQEVAKYFSRNEG